MASATWTSGLDLARPGLGRLADTQGLLLEEIELEDEELSEASTRGRSALPTHRFLQINPEVLYAAQETMLLLLIGIAANLLAFLLDHLIETLVAQRARTAQSESSFLHSYAVWTGSALLSCTISAMCVDFIGPASAGSGIPQMKSVLAGMRVHDYLSVRTLCAKMLSLVFALAGGLSVGKEGPYVHITACAAALFMRMPGFRRIARDDGLKRQMLSAACAAGVAATFGAPVGGVLFSIEVTSTYYSVQHLWKSLFASVCGALVFRGLRDTGSLGQGFEKTGFADMEQIMHNGEIYAFGVLGIICGLVGAAFVTATSSLITLVRELRETISRHGSRRRLLLERQRQRGGVGGNDGKGGIMDCPCTLLRCDFSSHAALEILLSRYGYTLLVAFSSAMLTFPFGFFRSAPQEVINELFRPSSFDMAARWLNPSLRINLVIYVVCKFVFTCVAVGCPISCGVFTPVFLIGAALGRLYGELLNDLTPVDMMITAGGYAVVGAAALAAGVTRTVSTSVIVFELTGQLNHMLPVLVAVLLATGVGNACNASIYDTMLALNKLPYIQPLKPHHAARRTATDVMDASLVPLVTPCSYGDALRVLRASESREVPIVDVHGALVASVPQAFLQAQIDRLFAETDEPKTGSVLDQLASRVTEALVGVQLTPPWTISHFPSLVRSTSEVLTSGPFGEGEGLASSMSSARDSLKLSSDVLPESVLVDTVNSESALASSSTGIAIDPRRVASPLHSCEKATGMRSPTSRSTPHLPPRVVISRFGQLECPALGRDASTGSGAAAGDEFSEEKLALLATPLDLGLDAPLGRRGRLAAINYAPTVVLAATPLSTIHMQFSLFATEHAYVTHAGQYIGVIRRSQLTGEEG